MWDNYIGRQIRRCNRNLLAVNLLLLAGLAVYAHANGRYLLNFFSGARVISPAELAAVRDPDELRQFFVRVEGEKSFDTGVQYLEQEIDNDTKQVKSSTVKAEYHVLGLGGKFLVVKTDPGDTGTVYKGALVRMPGDVYGSVVASAVHDEPRLKDMFLPVMLNANDYREEGWWTLGLGLPLLLLIGWNLSKWQKRATDFVNHPIYKRLQSFGQPEQVAQQMETETRMAPAEKIAGVKFSGPWLFRENFFGTDCFRLPELVWVYQKVTQHYTYFIPTGKSFAAVLNDRYGWSIEIRVKKKTLEAFLGRVMRDCPWAALGFSEELKRLWASRAGEFVAAVDERRKAYGKTPS